MVADADEPNNIRKKKVLGLGYWVQGFRCFPWMAVNFFLKDSLRVHPSTLQLLQNSANLPMVAKPLLGLLSDSFYIAGQRRIPYIAIGALLQALSWLAIAIQSESGISITTITLYLLLTNLGASIAEVANDAIVAESSKQTSQSSGELQSFVWMASSVGGVLGNLLGGLLIDRLSPPKMFLFFGLLLALQFFITVVVPERSLNLPKTPSRVGVREQLSLAFKNPDIARSIAWLGASYAVIPALTGTMFFYQTQHLKIESSVLGMSKVFGQVAMLAWGIIYDRWLKRVESRKVIAGIQGMTALLMASDVLFVKGLYSRMGVADSVYVVIFSGVLEVLVFVKILPFSVLIAKLCPAGCEGSLMALVMSVIALSLIVSGYLGVALAECAGVTGDDFSGFPLALLIQALCTLLPLYWSYCIPDDHKSTKKD
ncbi:hypothetical protein UlMin_024874 [Ulmus minor]